MYVAPQVPCRGNIGVRTSTHLAFLPTKYLLLLWWRCLRRRAHCCSLGRTPSQLAALATVTCWALLHTTSLHIASLSAFSVGAMWRSRRTRIRQQGWCSHIWSQAFPAPFASCPPSPTPSNPAVEEARNRGKTRLKSPPPRALHLYRVPCAAWCAPFRLGAWADAAARVMTWFRWLYYRAQGLEFTNQLGRTLIPPPKENEIFCVPASEEYKLCFGLWGQSKGQRV